MLSPSSHHADARLLPRVDAVLARLTAAEKIAMLHQYSPAVPRLGLPAFRTGTEALHGVAWLGTATVFPQPVGLAATWDLDLVRAVGEAVAVEVRAKHAVDPTVSLNVWAPVVNLLRDPRWGRNEEGWSEDPLLTARLATAYCRGLRGDHPTYARTTPVLKHLLAYNNETDRCRTSSSLRPRVLHEYDLPAFRGPLEAGVVDGLMPAYNLVNGRPCHVSPLIEDPVRRWSPHDLLVVSDAEAPANLVDPEHYFADHPTAHAAALRAGVDSFTEHGADGSFTVAQVTAALDTGLITEADVDRAVRRVLLVRARTGELAPPDDPDPYAGIGPADLDRPEHRALALDAARAQVVLLRNDSGLLPLVPRPGLRVAVVGPLADRLCQDWYSGSMPYRVTVADGLRDRLGPEAEVVVVDGVDRVRLCTADGRAVRVLPDEVPRVVLDGPDQPAGTDDAALFDVFDWGDGILTLRSTANGRYVTVDPGSGRLLADAVEPHGWEVQETFRLRPAEGAGETSELVHLGSGRAVCLDADGTLVARAAGSLHLVPTVVRDGVAAAVEAAHGCGTAVLVLGNDPLVNGRETEDRSTIALPAGQQRLLDAVSAACDRTVLVLMSSYPYAVTADRAAAVLWTSHAGQETGTALAQVLTGDHAPTGRLTQTWYARDADLPDLLEYDVIRAGRTYLYYSGTPLHPFGHGLTYTTFGYGPVRVTVRPAGTRTAAQPVTPADTLTVHVAVTNTGDRPGVEVVQVYSRQIDAGPDRPGRRLQGFARVRLAPGETREVAVDVPVAGLAHWDVTSHAPRVDPGHYDLLVGRSCVDVAGSTRVVVEAPGRASRRLVGVDVRAADFDDQDGIVLVDVARGHGDAVAPADGRCGSLLLRDVERVPAGGSLRVRVARQVPGDGRVELRAWSADGPLLAEVPVPWTGDHYRWTSVTTVLETGHPGRPVEDLVVVLRGDIRLDTLRVDPPDGTG